MKGFKAKSKSFLLHARSYSISQSSELQAAPPFPLTLCQGQASFSKSAWPPGKQWPGFLVLECILLQEGTTLFTPTRPPRSIWVLLPEAPQPSRSFSPGTSQQKAAACLGFTPLPLLLRLHPFGPHGSSEIDSYILLSTQWDRDKNYECLKIHSLFPATASPLANYVSLGLPARHSPVYLCSPLSCEHWGHEQEKMCRRFTLKRKREEKNCNQRKNKNRSKCYNSGGIWISVSPQRQQGGG